VKATLSYLFDKQLSHLAGLEEEEGESESEGSDSRDEDVVALSERYPVPVYGGRHDDIPSVDHPLEEGDLISLARMGVEWKVSRLMGHTLGHIYYYGSGMVLTGDTLFSAGCGRVFEGSMGAFY
jgi:glyoxylase-like metal-dependent hydrolase (beta-lactamase superfamily II)